LIPHAVESVLATWAAKDVPHGGAIVARETFAGIWTVDVVSRRRARKLAMAAGVARIPKRLRDSAPAGYAWLVYFERGGMVGLGLVTTGPGAKGEAIAINAWGGSA